MNIVDRELADARRELAEAETQFRLWSEARVDAEARYADAMAAHRAARDRSGQTAAAGAQAEASG